ncbi:MAG: NAD(+) diphosphatase [Arachnia propionica]|uniref:NAD(+) diphosphatase n=1 Tax=Arachnia propionica TaxID=1750 RepID=UPI0026FD1EC2|nr:NAD(+) diphosphatase [Arachnia propionica]
MTHWQQVSHLDRRDEWRDDEAFLDEIARSARTNCLHLDHHGRVQATEAGLHSTALTGGRQPGDLFLGQVGDDFWWVRRDAEAGRDVRDLDLTDEQTQLAFAALALSQWHGSRPTCMRCGAATRAERAGASRRCPACGAQVFPRTDPAVIVAVTDHDDRLLLTHARAWPGNRVSVQAGFIEAGESAEQAVHREILEETGLEVEEMSFVSTQPWPFPRSLMLGFTARADAAGLNLDRRELAWGRFHTREELDRAVVEGRLTLPGPLSLAIVLIRNWADL